MGSGTPQGKNNMVRSEVVLRWTQCWFKAGQMLGIAALVGITGLVYWMGYSDVDRRHRNDGKEYRLDSPTALTMVKFLLKRVDRGDHPTIVSWIRKGFAQPEEEKWNL
jgi:hypothetical protein